MVRGCWIGSGVQRIKSWSSHQRVPPAGSASNIRRTFFRVSVTPISGRPLSTIRRETSRSLSDQLLRKTVGCVFSGRLHHEGALFMIGVSPCGRMQSFGIGAWHVFCYKTPLPNFAIVAGIPRTLFSWETTSCNPQDVMKMVKENDAKFVDFRFHRYPWQGTKHVTVPVSAFEPKTSSRTAMPMVRPSPAGRASGFQTYS